jgi:ribonuclease P protein component
MVTGALRGLGTFRAVMRGGYRWDAGFLRCYVLLERTDHPGFRVGISVSPKDFSAVQRNRLRRLVREGIRMVRPEVSLALQAAVARADMVVQVRGTADARRVRLADVHPLTTQLCKRLIRQVASGTP